MKELYVPYTTVDGRRRMGVSTSITAADHLIKFKKNAHENPKRTHDAVWDVLDEVIKVWKKQRPHEFTASIIELEEAKQDLKDKKFATTKLKAMRRTLDIPTFIEIVMRRLYTLDELPFDKDWYHALWDKYPGFRVSEKR